jgi:hypothetical protein
MSWNEESLLDLLGYNGQIYTLECGYWLKFEVRTVEKTDNVPHGVSYSFTLHTTDGTRILGYDNAHTVLHRGGQFVAAPAAADHWHRDESDEGRPYTFVNADQLIVDFFSEVEAKLLSLGLPFDVKE